MRKEKKMPVGFFVKTEFFSKMEIETSPKKVFNGPQKNQFNRFLNSNWFFGFLK